jgi:hypothetical protein
MSVDLSFPRVAENLLVNGAHPNQLGGVFGYPLFAAIGRSNPESMRLLLDHVANPNVMLENGFTPWHEAASDKKLDLVQILVECKANINALARGFTPLAAALGVSGYPDRKGVGWRMEQSDPRPRVAPRIAAYGHGQ